MPKTTNRLTAIKAQTVKKPGLHPDGAGLYLKIGAGGSSRSWVLRYMLKGRPRYLGLGSASHVTLAKARELANRARELSRQGVDPIDYRKEQQASARAANAKAMTFRQCGDALIAIHERAWKSAKHREQWRNTLRNVAYPKLGDMVVDEIDTEHVLAVLEPIWLTKPETASRLRGRIEMVLDWAKARGARTGDNPARWRGHLANLLPKTSKVAPVQHHAALPFNEVPAFLAEIRALGGLTALALELVILTAVRTNEALGARWSEFDLAQKLWVIPAARMKAGKEHRIPLSTRALGVVKELELIKRSELVFPGLKSGRPLSNMAMLMLLRRMKRTHLTVHGFRSSFRDWAAETTNFPNFVVEMALARRYGDRIATEITGKDGGAIEMRDCSDIEIARRVAFMLGQAAAKLEAVEIEEVKTSDVAGALVAGA